MLQTTLHRVLIFTYKKIKYYVVILYSNINNTIMPPIAYFLPSSPSSPSSSSRLTTLPSPTPSSSNLLSDDEDIDDDWENIDIDYYECDERRRNERSERRSSTANSAVRYVKAIQKVAQRYSGGCMSATERRLLDRLVKEKRV